MKRRTHPLLTSVAAAILALLYLPLIAVAAMSVNRARFGVFRM